MLISAQQKQITMAFAASNLKTLQSSVAGRHALAINRCFRVAAPQPSVQCTCSLHSGPCSRHGNKKSSTVAQALPNRKAVALPGTKTRSVEDIIQANEKFRATFKCDLPAPPAKKIAIVTCMDARIHPEEVMGFNVGDAHVIRNAGGRISIDALRSLVISQRMLGTEEVLVIHHTQCGMATLQNDDVYKKVESDIGSSARDIIDGFDFMPLDKDLESNVRKDVKEVVDCAAIPDSIEVHGFIYDVVTGRLIPVDE